MPFQKLWSSVVAYSVHSSDLRKASALTYVMIGNATIIESCVIESEEVLEFKSHICIKPGHSPH